MNFLVVFSSSQMVTTATSYTCSQNNISHTCARQKQEMRAESQHLAARSLTSQGWGEGGRCGLVTCKHPVPLHVSHAHAAAFTRFARHKCIHVFQFSFFSSRAPKVQWCATLPCQVFDLVARRPRLLLVNTDCCFVASQLFSAYS
jgi:hypothetical protein